MIYVAVFIITGELAEDENDDGSIDEPHGLQAH
jgi:hypothetical protein